MDSTTNTATSATVALELQGLTRRHPGVTALDGVDLTLMRGEVHALAGENGAGKSSLIKILCGADRPDAGRMRLFGEVYAPQSPLAAMRAGIRVVHQELHMLGELSVAENLLFERLPRTRLGLLDRAAMERRARELLALVGLDELSPATRVGTLGMAQQQLLEIAKALSNQRGGTARIVIMDEPTATLTPRETDRLLAIIRKLRGDGVTVVFVSHHLQELFEVCDRVTVLRNGRHVATQPMAGTSTGELVRLMVGRELVERPARVAPAIDASQPTALRVEGLRHAGRRDAPSIDFSLRYGEIVGLAGLVGSGRTETLRAIFGADRAAAGQVFRDDRPVRIASPKDALAHGICLVTENRKEEGLVLDMPIRANLSLARLGAVSRGGLLSAEAENAAARRMVGELQIRLASIAQPVRQLSGGNQQKVVLGKWLLRDPKVLLLDEPTRGVDVGAKAEIHALLERMAAQGMAVLVVSSDLRELIGLCDRMLVMSRGVLVGELPRAQFDEEAILAMAYREYLVRPPQAA
ncbi:sugar ABC transporter ATP-binding protein [Rhizobacter sp. OV335]|uniref:sugar ABC transporter ATP-binding protein n=1 Tax=Rhizobacter sp. OV335 TaxID=1500264 RepID=UPI00091FCB21|nr:sugar ABC transporter ATP-binding protein [Rhizobacter sp. OV335]SHN14993.1 ribose transport system ATP-binding protein [Rhizobacter sp. OV335]